MRASQFRPTFDRLDGRVVLTELGSVASGYAVAATVIEASGGTPTPLPGSDIDFVKIWDWNLAGTPPAPSYDPSHPPLDPNMNFDVAQNYTVTPQ